MEHNNTHKYWIAILWALALGIRLAYSNSDATYTETPSSIAMDGSDAPLHLPAEVPASTQLDDPDAELPARFLCATPFCRTATISKGQTDNTGIQLHHRLDRPPRTIRV